MNRNSILTEFFKLGKEELNRGEFYKAHEIWEHIWKHGTDEDRLNIKGMIQLSGGLIKINMGQFDSGIYLLRKSIENIETSKKKYTEIDIKDVINQIKGILNTESIIESMKPKINIK